MASDLTIYRNNSMVLDISNLENSSTGIIMDAATVEVTITDVKGVNLPGVSFPIIANEVSPANYQAEIPGTLDASGIDRGYTIVMINKIDVSGYIKQGTRFQDRKFEDRGK